MGDRGIPGGFRRINGYYGHTLKLINAVGDWVYTQFHLKSDQGIVNQTDPEQTTKNSPDHGQKDLYFSIEQGK
jgi:catalase